MVLRKIGLNWRDGAGEPVRAALGPPPAEAEGGSYLVHARVGEEQRGVLQRDGGRRVHVAVLVADEEVDELLANLSCSQRGIHSGPALWGGRNHVVRQQLITTSLSTGLQGRDQVTDLGLGPLSRSAAARPGRSSRRVETCCTFQAKETAQQDDAGVEVECEWEAALPCPPPPLEVRTSPLLRSAARRRGSTSGPRLSRSVWRRVCSLLKSPTDCLAALRAKISSSCQATSRHVPLAPEALLRSTKAASPGTSQISTTSKATQPKCSPAGHVTARGAQLIPSDPRGQHTHRKQPASPS